MTFGDRLKMLRYEKGLTQDDLGYIFNVTKSCICCYENDSRQPSIDMLIKLATYFRVSIDYLLGLEYERSNQKNKLLKNDLVILNILRENPLIYDKILNDSENFISKVREIL